MFTAGLPPSLSPSICQTDSCWATPSVVVHFVQSLLIQPEPLRFFLHLLSKYAFIFHSALSLPPQPLSLVWKNTQFCAIYSNFQKEVKKVFCVGYMRTSVTSACNQRLFGLLHLLLAMRLRLSCHRLELYETSEELEWTGVDHSLEIGHSLLSTSPLCNTCNAVCFIACYCVIDE